MSNGKYEPQCGNCTHVAPISAPQRSQCKIHNFVMPVFKDYVVCADWRGVHSAGSHIPDRWQLAPGCLFRWDEGHSPTEIGRFEQIQELVLDRSVDVVEDPKHGWVIFLPEWDYPLYPAPGEEMRIKLDDATISFTIRQVHTVVTYSFRESDRSLRLEDRPELKRAAIPGADGGAQLRQWLDTHHGIDESKRAHTRNLENPRFLNKNKPLRFLDYIIGKPERGEYSLRPGLGLVRFGS